MVGCLAAGLVLLGLFAAIELRTPSPMLDLSLFRRRAFSAPMLSAILNYMTLSATIFLVPFYLIQGRGMAPSQAGLILTAQPILMASRALCAAAGTPDDYRKVYDRLLSQSSRPVILHWLGSMFDPALDGYWGSDSLDIAADVVVELIGDNVSKVDGIKVSLLEASREVALRNRLPESVRLYTGDDFNYPELIRGDADRYSDALLGIFAAIAPAAAVALKALDDGDLLKYDEVFAPTVPLSRQIFSAPTYYYKTGIAFLAWLNGHQPGFSMVGGLQTGRSLPHLADTFRLADQAGVLTNPELAVTRFRQLLRVGGVDA